MQSATSVRGLWCAAALSFVVLQLGIYSAKQPSAGGPGRWSDAVHYSTLAEQFLAGEKPLAPAPFAYRIAVPWLAARLAGLTGQSIDTSFLWINIAFLLALVLVVYHLALCVCSPPFAALACMLTTLPYHGHARRLFFEPVFVDTAWLLAALSALAVMGGSWRKPWGSVALCLLSFMATCVRETGLLIPAAYLLGHFSIRRRGYPALGMVMLVSSLLALAWTRAIAVGTGDYSAIETVYRMTITSSASWRFGVSILLAFGGPLLALLLVERALVTKMVKRYPHLVCYAACVLILSFVGGENTVRFLGWTSPVVLIATAAALEAAVRRTRDIRSPARWACASILPALLVYDVWMQHPFDGYYADWTAWVRWGGLTFSSAESLTPALGALALMLGAVAIWRRTERRSMPARRAPSSTR